ncbi:Cthe_2314 family HEPN domain-containing protein [Paenibacillus sp. N1-5-1-14]|uniref:Cthe_2314 family HEPN domain-containing protein n=1 Tax=Paenibacillus radicibacter TaxID=2972488 RepID=UPI002158E196|nr:Cthe_2314 family HEPN domain-containing protein [Paenibacillus radicibacter]MCR8645290.1 Cthe_2314 family HEPN domain-containing protein [Paenibacillus radicibacter]
MLRFLFDESPRVNNEELQHVFDAIRDVEHGLSEGRTNLTVPLEKMRLLELWCAAFVDGVNELEQSTYCARRFAEKVSKPLLEEMTEQEKMDYYRFVYFYKNGLIRVFSLLDKLGYFMNESLGLQTEKMKIKYSFFTVLRNMYQNHLHVKLNDDLFMLKQDHKDVLAKLRKQRNMEIHYINMDMMDDLALSRLVEGQDDDRIRIENAKEHAQNLHAAYEMVCRCLLTVFTYIRK